MKYLQKTELGVWWGLEFYWGFLVRFGFAPFFFFNRLQVRNSRLKLFYSKSLYCTAPQIYKIEIIHWAMTRSNHKRLNN